LSLLASYLQHAIAVFLSLLRGAVITIEVTTFAIFFGLILGTIAAFGKLSKDRFSKFPVQYMLILSGELPFLYKS